MTIPGKPSFFATGIGRKAALGAAGLALLGSAAVLKASEPLPPDEEGEPITLPAPKASWVYVDRGFTVPGTAISDTDTG